MPKVDLIYLTQTPTENILWELGKVHTVAPVPQAVSDCLELLLANTNATAILFWDERIPLPASSFIQKLMDGPADVWHAGLRLGTKGLPKEMDYVSPGWMFNKDPDLSQTAVSWRISLRACLVRITVLQTLGQIDRAFETLEGAGLEIGYRWIWGGAITLHKPELLPIEIESLNLRPSMMDDYLFIMRHYQHIWQRYVLFRRSLSNGHFIKEYRTYQKARQQIVVAPALPKGFLPRPPVEDIPRIRVSVLIPTISRYLYLKDTLGYLCQQTYPPLEVICVDQTPQPQRQPEIYEQYPGLNLKVIWKDESGQCSARNTGLEKVQGDAVLFLDDDVEIDAGYIEALVEGLARCRTDIIQGVWFSKISNDEIAAESDRYFRLSDRFATGNGMARIEALKKTGGFDLNYNRNYRADADMGMRLYLAGTLSMITPHAREVSLSPPTGGLKLFGATDGSRNIKLLRPWPAATQTYYWLRYLTYRQVREALLLNIIASAIPRERRYSALLGEKIMYVFSQIWKLPFRVWGTWQSVRLAQKMLKNGVQIPKTW
jgi:glycosyltransferase involved in cell wall biosynthesis